MLFALQEETMDRLTGLGTLGYKNKTLELAPLTTSSLAFLQHFDSKLWAH